MECFESAVPAIFLSYAPTFFSSKNFSIVSLACMGGYYGSRCAMKCSSMCQTNSVGRTCEMDTGKCISGCSSMSYTGDNCDIQCNSNCIEMCSSSDGTCSMTSNSTRCKAGYRGMYCNESTLSSKGLESVLNNLMLQRLKI